MSDQGRLASYVEVWWQAAHDLLDLLEELRPEEWSLPTDLPGWDVHDVAAHSAHLEAVLAGAPEETAEVGDPAHVRGMMGLYTEIGVVNRRDLGPDAIIRELREAVTARHTALLADPPTDASAAPPIVFGGLPWDWGTLLRNRPLDVWMHEQDIRRATGRPGGLSSPAARHSADYLAESLGFVLGKRVGAPPGTSLVLDVEGSDPVAFAVDERGRGVRLPEPPADPTLTVSTDRESLTLLSGGRRVPADGAVRVEGDQDLGRQVLASMATTP